MEIDNLGNVEPIKNHESIKTILLKYRKVFSSEEWESLKMYIYCAEIDDIKSQYWEEIKKFLHEIGFLKERIYPFCASTPTQHLQRLIDYLYVPEESVYLSIQQILRNEDGVKDRAVKYFKLKNINNIDHDQPNTSLHRS